jgi:BirA family transcriptional regulator, biotin operon repressor / biotin---[acetyl-CoA-carboxylase] ligase
MTEFLSRQERFDTVGSTNDVVRGWLADGTAEVCLAVADAQTQGRGRDGRRWESPAGAALLLSLGFRPDWLAPDRAWRLVATTSLAMADAAEEVGGLADGAIRLKWPNDLVVEGVDGGGVRKLAGLLGETDGLGTDDPRVVVGLGINADWAPADFPPELVGSMTSLREASGGRPADRAALLDAFLGRLEVRIEALRGGRFDVADWTTRQLTTGRDVEVSALGGSLETLRAVGVDAATGALLVADPTAPGGERQVLVGEIVHVRLAEPAPTTGRV